MTDGKAESPRDEVARLRNQLAALTDPDEPVMRAAAGAADQAAGVAAQAGEKAKQAYAAVNERTEWIADRTRQSPIVTLAIACVAGYVLGRIVR